MTEIRELRDSARVAVNYLLEFRQAGRERDGIGRAVDLSESGLRFIAPHALEPGSYVTVRVPRRARGTPVLHVLATVVRCLQLETGSGFAIGCAYD